MSAQKPQELSDLSAGSRLDSVTTLDDLLKLETDTELLSKYVECRDRVAIERLIVRYAPMVTAVCRATAHCRTDAEDAFQATFLVLVKSAHKVRKQSSVAAWLHGVAYRIACRTRMQRRRTQLFSESPESQVDLQSGGAVEDHSEDPMVLVSRKIELEWLFRELEELPTKLKSILIEFYLHGFTAQEISQRMEISVSAVEGRLRRGRHLLRTRLVRHGLSLSVALGSVELLKQQLHAAEALGLSSKFTSHHLSDPSSTVARTSSGDSSTVQSLVQGELAMLKPSLLYQSGVSALILGTAGAVTGWAYMLDGNGGGSAASKGGESTVTIAASDSAPEAIAAPPVVLGQMGMGAMAGSPVLVKTEPEQPVPIVQWDAPEGPAPDWLRRNEATESIEKRIESNRTSLREAVAKEPYGYNSVPLSQVAQRLSDEFKLAILINAADLETEGVDPDTPITVELPPCSLREALGIMLQPLGLTYRVREAGIEITTESAVDDGDGTLRCYDLSYIYNNSANVGSVVHTITESIEPDSWLENGGSSTISMIGSMMVVSSPDTTHFKIEDLLRSIAKMSPGNATPKIGRTSLQGSMGGGMF